MASRILDVRPGGIVEALHDDNVIAVTQDVAGILDACRESRNSNGKMRGFRKPETFSHVASIPLALVEILRAQGMDILHDEDAMKKFLNNPEYAGFRTSTGRV